MFKRSINTLDWINGKIVQRKGIAEALPVHETCGRANSGVNEQCSIGAGVVNCDWKRVEESEGEMGLSGCQKYSTF